MWNYFVWCVGYALLSTCNIFDMRTYKVSLQKTKTLYVDSFYCLAFKASFSKGLLL